jgi:hypothetical protein
MAAIARPKRDDDNFRVLRYESYSEVKVWGGAG